MKQNFDQHPNNIAHRAPTDGGGGVRRLPTDGGGGVRRAPTDGGGGVR